MKSSLLTEIFRIKSLMSGSNLIIESRVPVIGKFDYGKIIDDVFPKGDKQVENSNLKYGDIIEIKTIADLKSGIDDILSKPIDLMSKEDKAFLKEFHTKFLDLTDSYNMGRELRTEFQTISGDDAAVALLNKDLNEIFPPDQVKQIESGMSPNKYETMRNDILLGKKREVLDKLKDSTPTKDEVEMLEVMEKRGLINKKEFDDAMKKNPGFLRTLNLYTQYLELKKAGELGRPTPSFEDWLVSRGSKSPTWTGQTSRAVRRIGSFVVDFANGRWIAGLLKAVGIAIATYVTDDLYVLIKGIGKSTEKIVQKTGKVLKGNEVSDDTLKTRWTDYWSSSDPKVMLSDNTEESVFIDGSNSQFKNNAPEYERLGSSTTNLKLKSKIKIGGVDTDTVDFVMVDVPLAGGSDLFPDKIKNLTSIPSVTKTVEDFKDFIKSAWVQDGKSQLTGNETYKIVGKDYVVSDGTDDFFYTLNSKNEFEFVKTEKSK